MTEKALTIPDPVSSCENSTMQSLHLDIGYWQATWCFFLRCLRLVSSVWDARYSVEGHGCSLIPLLTALHRL
jgi:hypothetical protein